MNLQALMKQAQAMQKNMVDSKNKIDAMIFVGESELVKIEMNGKKEVLKVEIKEKELEKDEIEILEDMIMLAVNDAINKVNKEIQEKMGNQAGAFGNLF